MNLSGVSIAALRSRYESRLAPPLVIRALRADRRAGARSLAETLEARRQRAAGERRRLRRLFEPERRLWSSGTCSVAGLDEAGMGPLAGPVVAAAVILPADALRRADLSGLDDSKRLSEKTRQRLDAAIRRVALGIGVGWATPLEIDRLNIYWAGMLAMRRAVEALDVAPERVLVDARTVPELTVPQESVVHGDASVGSIASASVVAKVYRDAWLRDLDRRYPGYGLARNAGYGTSEHLRGLRRLGPTPAHRYSFEPVRQAAAARRSARA